MSDQSIALTRLIAVSVSAIVCSEGDPERFFENIETMKRLAAAGSMSLSPEVLDLLANTVQAFNEILQTDPAAQEY